MTGVLTDTRARTALAAGVGRALDLATSPGAELRDRRARAMVRERFGIETMAAALAGVYADVASGQVGGSRRDGQRAP